MKDEFLMKTSVPSLDGSRFASTPASLLNNVLAPAAVPVLTANRTLAARFASALPEESLVIDDRSQISPAQMVENKLVSRLKELSMSVSHLQMRGLVRNRFEA